MQVCIINVKCSYLSNKGTNNNNIITNAHNIQNNQHNYTHNRII